ncbi:MAG: hypothetical protein L0Z62_30040 [Gemmataceae bacterium]|nr:hypothetical protein [Gemmataceae bacterium]
MPPRLIASAALAALLLGSIVSAQDPLQSGPPVGAKNDRSGFFPQWVTGPTAGKRLCPV